MQFNVVTGNAFYRTLMRFLKELPRDYVGTLAVPCSSSVQRDSRESLNGGRVMATNLLKEPFYGKIWWY